MRNPLFIFGFPRSGTTLLRSMIGQHSKITLVNEPEIILALRHAGYSVASKFEQKDRKKLLCQLGRIGLCRRHIQRLPEKVLNEFLDCDETLSFLDVYEKLLPTVFGDHKLWGEKSNNNIFFIRDLSAMYPHAIFIHIVRDARSSSLSYYQKKTRKNLEIRSEFPTIFSMPWFKMIGFFAERAALWERYLTVAYESKMHIPSDSWIEIRFEDFLHNPRTHLQNVCDAADLKFEECMLDSAFRQSDPVLATNAAYAHRKLAQDLDKSRARSLDCLSSELIWVIELFAGKMMKRLGYNLRHPKISTLESLAIYFFLGGYHIKLKSDIKSYFKKRGLTAELKSIY